MLQISNLDDGKSEWTLSETHIIVPMIDGDVISPKDSSKLSGNSLSLNTQDDIDQTVLTNGLEHSLVIGLDRNLFETHNSRNDLLVIQNSDLKLLSCNSDVKNPVTYTLSYVEQDRGEILWESPVLKERMKSEWCSNDKTIFEVKDTLDYDDSIRETSKSWHDGLGKNNEQISLDEGADLTSQVSKILIPVEESFHDDRKLEDDIEKNTHFIVNYYSTVQNCEAVSLLPTSALVSKSSDSIMKPKSVTVENENIVSNELLVKNSCKSLKLNDISFENNTEEHILDIMPEVVIEEEYSSSVSENNYNQFVVDMKSDFVPLPHIKPTKEVMCEDMTISNGVSCSLPEKSLPLKKKAKMKTTVIKYAGPEIVDSSLKQKDGNNQESSLKYEESTVDIKNNNSKNHDTDEPLINKIKKRKKTTKVKKKCNKKRICEKLLKSSKVTNSVQMEESGKAGDTSGKLDVSNNEKITNKTFDKNDLNFDCKKFNSIYDLIEELRRCRIINSTVLETLRSGLLEMDVDILKEINAKQGDTSPVDSASYSPHLKAFALVLYFKQPAAFNHLASIYKNGWPSLKIIKDWKRRVNSQQRPNFVGIQSTKSENNNS